MLLVPWELARSTSNLKAASWLQDIETTKSLLTHPSLGTKCFATRCFEVINRPTPRPTHEPSATGTPNRRRPAGTPVTPAPAHGPTTSV
ncbi:hypothetical protein N7471_012417 [Penicillium samsonianum]|uniref:uncharacterized protein n=1 Tax=Penicillium samsonianum TaxID=1882272 RepID=UPI0025468DF9|nr:uncharacterized protein N7471_012417 [Penicillium samsonianum]KAJ6125100.1 hypothetical protein N7471_012417 [Penicillium samsonianum]